MSYDDSSGSRLASGDGSRRSLDGVRVLEVGHLIAGPFCGRMLADHGADVVKIEPPDVGDPMRQWGGQYEGIGLHWPYIGRGKRSVTLDLRTPEDQAAFREMAADVDVVVENLRPGTLESWGIGWSVLQALNPRLVLTRVTGFGQTGPYRDRAGYGSVGEAMSGFRYLCGEPGGAPVRVGISLSDSLAGTYAFLGCLLALRERDGTPEMPGSGMGQIVDVALYEALWTHMEGSIAEFDKLGVVRQPTGATLPGIAPSNAYLTADGSRVVIGANQDSVFARLARLMRRPEWSTPGSPYATHTGRADHQVSLDEQIEAWTCQLSSEQLLDELAAAGIPSGRIYTIADIAEDPQFAAREMIIRVSEPTLDGEKIPMPGVVPKLSRTPGYVTRGAPRLGEHTKEVLAQVGLVEPSPRTANEANRR
jgi:crotonobetainyl-CoA:carnitine CoA-transferase CaiB-like acyl-CoA transferase